MRYIRLIKYLSNWWLHFAVKIGLANKDPLLFRTRNNIIIEIPQRIMHEFKEIFMEGSYTRDLELAMPDRPEIIDVGANVGFFTFFAASQFPGAQIYSYEPIGNNSDTLMETVQVPCVTLQEIFDKHQLDRCHLLKMDYEGSEYEILYNCPGTYLHRLDQMAIEVHRGKDVNQNITALADYLRSLDFNTHQDAEYML